MSRFSVDLREQQKEWINSKLRKTGMSQANFFRRLLDAAIASDWDPQGSMLEYRLPQEGIAPEEVRVGPQPEVDSWAPDQDLDTKDQFLEAIRRLYAVDLAAEKCGLSISELRKLMKDEEFVEELQFARALYVSQVERELYEVGVGLRSGNASALEKWLNANSGNYGRPSREKLDRVVNPLLDSIREALQDEVSPLEGGSAAVSRALAKVKTALQQKRSELPV